ncbi:hypothetical protein EJ110_NYTH09851 [Nymphaea thermarum]|nr:hypothetical protein EJ110_NYTH09851 [Nymphaea thermarum]
MYILVWLMLQLMAVPVQVRILALTATPGCKISYIFLLYHYKPLLLFLVHVKFTVFTTYLQFSAKKHTVQNVIDNLQISVLEYRNESDNDVKKYMHDRQLELIERFSSFYTISGWVFDQVAMSNDAVRINNLLLEAIQPLVSRLCALGVLQHRDLSTFSPCALLNSRDKFRQSPPANLPQAKYGEVEGYFGVLITLYYIHKLLSSHGMRPAYEMLQEKMQQGYAALYYLIVAFSSICLSVRLMS